MKNQILNLESDQIDYVTGATGDSIWVTDIVIRGGEEVRMHQRMVRLPGDARYTPVGEPVLEIPQQGGGETIPFHRNA